MGRFYQAYCFDQDRSIRLFALSSFTLDVDCCLYNGSTTWLGIKFTPLFLNFTDVVPLSFDTECHTSSLPFASWLVAFRP